MLMELLTRGFDVAPSVVALLPGAVVLGGLPGVPQTVPTMS